MWHRTGPDRDRDRDPDPGRRERVGPHPWVRLPAGGAPATLDDRPGEGRAPDLPSAADPPGGGAAVVGERGPEHPDGRAPRFPVP